MYYIVRNAVFSLIFINLVAAGCSESPSAEEGAGDTDADADADTDTQDSGLPSGFDEACDGSEPFCFNGELIICEGDQRVSTECQEKSFCNFGECHEVDVSLPGDAAPHNSRSEWWYYTGHIEDDSGHWGFQVTIFKYTIGLKGYMCHVGISDKDAGEHYHHDEFAVLPQKWTTTPPIEIFVGRCKFELDGNGRDHIIGIIPKGGEKDKKDSPWKLDLELEPTKGPAFHGGNGEIPMSDSGGRSWYYSYTRIDTEGTLETPDGQIHDVTGQAWMDHQWGPFDISQFKGWDWWSMQFDDGYEIMLFQFYSWEDKLVMQAGSVIDPSGNQTELEGLDDFTIESLRSWESTHTDGIYPLDWDIAIPNGDWVLEVRTHIDDSEMYNMAQNYWESHTVITGTRDGQKVNGVGFTELTGYASDLLDPPGVKK
ncbi:MAG: hypothetical protein GY854_33060 [Deltaproteobacteria bacterium]|nr:hypothetical protein [Deltaproteobacteria bacterium]